MACAEQTFEAIVERACLVCSQMLNDDGSCPNWLCDDPRRRIARIHAIAYQSGPLRTVINNYKYRGARGWAVIFGRLVLGWLRQHAADDPPGLIVANPGYPGPDGTWFRHAETVIDAAAREDVLRRWPFDVAEPRAIIKVRATPKSAANTAKAKREAACELRSALSVPDAARTAGRRILVYDDICTTASQLDAVADCLIDEGRASHVEAVVLARAPWRRRT